MKEQAIKKINGLGKAGHIIANIVKVLMIIAAVAAIVATITFGRIPKGAVTFSAKGSGEVVVDYSAFGLEMNEDEKQKAENSGWSIHVNGYHLNATEATENGMRWFSEESAKTTDIHDIAGRLVLVDLAIIVMTVTMFFAASFFKSLRYCASPFEENVLTKMQRLAYSLIPWALISFSSFNFSDFLNGDANFGITINLEMVLIVLVVIALMHIFRYGAMLQQESDETL